MYVCPTCKQPADGPRCGMGGHPTEPVPGLEGWRIDRYLDQGGQGNVVLCRDKSGNPFAIKLFKISDLDDDLQRKQVHKSWRREVRALSTLTHDHVVALVQHAEVGGLLLLATEYLPYTLDEVLKTGPLPLPRAVRLAAELADALTYIHDRGIVHGDIKPKNIGLDHHDRLRLFDFGLARRQGDSSTVAGHQYTALYAAPEQLMGEAPDPRSDLFSLGAVIYELVVGRPLRPPLPGRASHLLYLDTPLPDLPASWPAELIHSVGRLLEPDRHRRLQHAWQAQDLFAGLSDALGSGLLTVRKRWAELQAALPPLEARKSALEVELRRLEQLQAAEAAAAEKVQLQHQTALNGLKAIEEAAKRRAAQRIAAADQALTAEQTARRALHAEAMRKADAGEAAERTARQAAHAEALRVEEAAHVAEKGRLERDMTELRRKAAVLKTEESTLTTAVAELKRRHAAEEAELKAQTRTLVSVRQGLRHQQALRATAAFGPLLGLAMGWLIFRADIEDSAPTAHIIFDKLASVKEPIAAVPATASPKAVPPKEAPAPNLQPPVPATDLAGVRVELRFPGLADLVPALATSGGIELDGEVATGSMQAIGSRDGEWRLPKGTTLEVCDGHPLRIVQDWSDCVDGAKSLKPDDFPQIHLRLREPGGIVKELSVEIYK